MSSMFDLGSSWPTLIIIVVAVFVPLVFTFYIRAAMKGIGAPVYHPMVPPMQLAPMQVPPPVAHTGPLQIKKATCRHCGASKVQPPKTATLYCDYCGALVDWDFRIAVTTAGSARPGPALRQLMAQEKAIQTQARLAGDRQAYGASLRRVFEQHMRSCPAAYSLRIGDPTFYAAQLAFLVAIDTECGFDPEMQAREAAIEQAHARLQALGGHGAPVRVERNGFAQLVAARKAATERWKVLVQPHMHLDPNEMDSALAGTIVNSTFVQYWLPFLERPDQDWLIQQLGLKTEYVPIEPVQTTERHCGNCGSSLSVVVGARRVVCERCGYLADVQQPEIPCTGCGSPLSVPAGASHFCCPHCRADLRPGGAEAV